RAPLGIVHSSTPRWTPKESREAPNKAERAPKETELFRLSLHAIGSTLCLVKPNGDAMKAIREARGISLQQLAKDIGRDVGFLSRVERNQQGAGDETLHRYAARLKVPIDAITPKEAS